MIFYCSRVLLVQLDLNTETINTHSLLGLNFISVQVVEIVLYFVFNTNNIKCIEYATAL